jgi:hypothetical protein
MLKPNPFQHLKRAAPLLTARCAQHLWHEGDVLQDGASGKQFEVLEHKPDTATILLDLTARKRTQAVAVDHDLAVAGALLKQQQTQKRRLAGPARTREEHELAFFDGERQVPKRVYAATVKL